MSYILDALQRAEAERERGRVPGLKSQLVPPPGRERTRGTTLRPWHALAGLVVLLAVVSFWWWMSAEAPAVPASAPPPLERPEVSNAVPQVAPVQPPVPASSPQPIATLAEPVQPILAPSRPAPTTTKPTAATSTPATPSAPVAATDAKPSAPAPAPAPAPAATNAAVPTFGELSAEARAQLPAVNVSGSTYSQNPALRMLIANGKVVQEGQDIAPGLRLETIGPRSAVLNHQGLRYSIGY